MVKIVNIAIIGSLIAIFLVLTCLDMMNQIAPECTEYDGYDLKVFHCV